MKRLLDTVAYWFALWPRNSRIESSCRGLCVCDPRFFPGFCSFFALSKDMKMTLVCEYVICASLCPAMDWQPPCLKAPGTGSGISSTPTRISGRENK